MTSNSGIEAEVVSAVEDGRPIEVVAATVDQEIQERLKIILRRILARYDYSHLEAALFSCTLELAVNANRANVKTIYFEEKNWDLGDNIDYAERLRTFKQEVLSGNWLKTYGDKSAARGLVVRIRFNHSSDGLRIEVINNRPLHPEDEKRIRKKFSTATAYKNLVDFHRAHGTEESEGEGLGVALSVLILKSEKIPPSVLRIGSDGHQTMARIEIPFAVR